MDAALTDSRIHATQPAAFHAAHGSAYSVYVLVERGARVRYIGITRQRPEKRLLQHYAEALVSCRNHKTQWIKHCVTEGIPIDIKLVRTGITLAKAQELEIRLIRFFRLAFNLVNSHPGGAPGQSVLSPESKARRAKEKARAKSLMVPAGAFLGTFQFQFASGEVLKYTIRQGERRNQIRVDGYSGDHGWDWLMRQLLGKLAMPRRIGLGENATL